jgi:hypothetical protein
MNKHDDEIEDEFGDDEEEDALPAAEPENTTDLVTVAQARNMKEAKAMKSILESAEITAFIGQGEITPEQEAAAAAGPGIPVLVPEELAVEAEEILAEAAMSADDDEEDFDDEDFDEEWDVEEAEEDEDYLDDDDLDDLEDGEEDEDLDDEEFALERIRGRCSGMSDLWK